MRCNVQGDITPLSLRVSPRIAFVRRWVRPLDRRSARTPLFGAAKSAVPARTPPCRGAHRAADIKHLMRRPQVGPSAVGQCLAVLFLSVSATAWLNATRFALSQTRLCSVRGAERNGQL